MCGNPRALQQFKEYDKINSEHVDSFLATYLKDSKYQKLSDLFKCLFVLSHGWAGVEHGLSINNEVMESNLGKSQLSP